MKNQLPKFILNYLTSLAKRVLVEHKPRLIVIAGNKDNITTKNIIHTLLNDQFDGSIRKSSDKLTSPLVILLTVFGFEKKPSLVLWLPFLISVYFKSKSKEYPKYLIIDIGEAETLTEILKPEIIVLTSNLDYSPVRAKIIINGDDSDLTEKHLNSIKVAIENVEADYVAEDINYKSGDFRISMTGSKISVKASLKNEGIIYPYLFAFAVGKMLNIQSLNIKKSIEKYLTK